MSSIQDFFEEKFNTVPNPDGTKNAKGKTLCVQSKDFSSSLDIREAQSDPIPDKPNSIQNAPSEASRIPLGSDPAISFDTNTINAHLREQNPEKDKESVRIEYQVLDAASAPLLYSQFVAVDLETTGLSPETDRIIEIGAVVYRNGKEIDSFNTLVNPQRFISYGATAVNNITNAMVFDAPKEKEALRQFMAFLAQYADRPLPFVAHNAAFDTSFLREAFKRQKIDCQFDYYCTLRASRKHLKELYLSSYGLNSVGRYFGIENERAHRATEDARVCGNIMIELLPFASKTAYHKNGVPAFLPLSDQEKDLCGELTEKLGEYGIQAKNVHVVKDCRGIVTVHLVYPLVRFKLTKKKSYLLLPRFLAYSLGMDGEKCTGVEGGANYVRVDFDGRAFPEKLAKCLCQNALEALKVKDNCRIPHNLQYRQLLKLLNDAEKENA